MFTKLMKTSIWKLFCVLVLAQPNLMFHFKLNNLEERAHACAALANLVLKPDKVPALMKHEIVKRVAPLILDNNEKVQEAASGLLR